jgi:presenilin-like A22 family membrane protease
MTGREGKAPRDRLGAVIGMWANRFEDVIYGIAFLLLAAAAALVVIGTVDAVIQAVTRQMSTLEGGALVLERILLTLIIAELAYTLRTDLLRHQIAAEPFLFIGLIATVRRILIVTAEFEQPQSDEMLTRLLLELGALALLVLAIAAAIFLIRYSGWKFVGVSPQADGHQPSSRD